MAFHPKNKHQGSYDFEILKAVEPQIEELIVKSKTGRDTLKFADPRAVKFLNRALLKSWYKITFWDFPGGYLVPPAPGRADYIHYISDLINKEDVTMLDVGTGASLIYPIIATKEYDWNVIASDIDEKAFKSCKKIIGKNKLKGIEFRLQEDAKQIFHGIINEDDQIDVTICNPPFHESMEDAEKGTVRKLRNLNPEKKNVAYQLNFGGKSNELWTPGGERKFITSMINESKHYRKQVKWFTTLVSREKNMKPLQGLLREARAKQVKIIEMEQGNKKSRVLCWRF